MKKNQQFEENYFSGDQGTYSKNYQFKVANIETLYKERIQGILKKYVSRRARLLDAACAFGDLLSFLDRDGYKTYGIDVSKFAIQEAKKHTKAELEIGDLNKKLPYQDSTFDGVCALDIIEHLESPYTFLLELHRVLKKGGVVFLQTPNINSIFEVFSKEKWFGYQDETHLYMFNRKSLQFLLKKSGYKIIVNETIASPFPHFVRKILKNTDIGGNLWLVAQKI